MITFKNIKLKNFLSVGEKPIELSLNTHQITTISGENGSAKSAICIDSIFYALYGKSFRKVKLSNLINSINGKGLRVEIEFSVGENEYKVIRGIKPNVFEIYINGTLKPQMPNVKDYQDFLSQHILKMDEKTFRQLVVIGSSSYTPFMALTSGERRTVIEDLLRIDIFSNMKDIVKQYISNNNAAMKELQFEIDKLQLKINMAAQTSKATIDAYQKSIDSDWIPTREHYISERDSAIQSYNESLSKVNKDLIANTKQDGEKLRSDIEKLSEIRASKYGLGNQIVTELDFFEKTNVCPTCSQKLDEFFVHSKIKELSERKERYNSFMSQIDAKINELKTSYSNVVNSYNTLLDSWNTAEEFRRKSISAEESIKRCDIKINELKKKIEEELSKGSTDVSEFKEELQKCNYSLAEFEKKSMALNVITTLLKDDGVKSIIIRNYLPVMNTLIRKYLSIIEFNLIFELDENFNEVIRTRNKESFEYNNFSEGEHLRIDTAIMFAFRELAKIQSSISTNLLILDEFDRGTLDYQGFQSIVSILQSCKNENIFVISHSPEYFTTIADRNLIAKKSNNFSELI